MAKTSTKTSRHEPVYNISSIFTAHRDLRPFTKLTLGDSGLTAEEADILILLYGEAELGWKELPVNPEGLVALKHLRMALVHDASLFARRLKKLTATKEPQIEVKSMRSFPNFPVHGNSQGARITKAGVMSARPIWDKFSKLSAKLLDGLPETDLEAHLRVNNFISHKLRVLADPAKQLLAD